MVDAARFDPIFLSNVPSGVERENKDVLRLDPPEKARENDFYFHMSVDMRPMTFKILLIVKFG